VSYQVWWRMEDGSQGASLSLPVLLDTE
jgi:hypothetical protein